MVVSNYKNLNMRMTPANFRGDRAPESGLYLLQFLVELPEFLFRLLPTSFRNNPLINLAPQAIPDRTPIGEAISRRLRVTEWIALGSLVLVTKRDD